MTVSRSNDPARTGVAWGSVVASAQVHEERIGGFRLQFGTDLSLEDLAPVVGALHRGAPGVAFAIIVDGRGLALEVTMPGNARDLAASLLGARPAA